MAGAACEHVAAAKPVVGTQTAPGGAGFCGFPPAHIQADLGAEGVRGEPLEAVKAGQVDATETVALGGQIDVRLVASGFLGSTLGGGRGVGVDLDLAVKGVEVGFDTGVALGDLLPVDFVELQGLAPIETPRFAPVALQAVGEGVGAGVEARVC